MKWIEYKNNFITVSKNQGKSKEYCDTWLDYAKRLFDKKIPIIYNHEHLSKLVGYKLNYLYGVVKKPKAYYRTYKIPKKNGGFREISEPLPGLKSIQKWILDEILTPLPVSKFAKAYVKKKSIKDNARFHINKKMVMTLDIKDYFGSIHPKVVYNFFIELGYNKSVSILLAGLCTLNGSLPQGAPTSAALSNLCTIKLDNEISEFTIARKIMYTRYADDMTFSGDFNVNEICKFVSHTASKYGFKLNKDKTRVRYRWQQQEVTGIVVNEKLQLSKKKRKEIRQSVYYIKKYGLEDHLKQIGENRQNYIAHIIGLIEFGVFINPKDNELLEYRTFFRNNYS